MKKIIFFTLILMSLSVHAGQRAITDTGKEIILNDDGTWIYSNENQNSVEKIKINEKQFTKPEESTFLLKSQRNNSAFWINPDKWSFKKAQNNPDAEYEFVLKGEDLYAMAITEGIEIEVDTLTGIALENAKNAASDAKILRKEYRVVNGNKVVYAEISGTIQGIKFTYLSYYYSNPSGSTQLTTYTGSNLVNRYRSEIDNFVNGLVTQ